MDAEKLAMQRRIDNLQKHIDRLHGALNESERKNAKLTVELEAVKRERDALMEDFKKYRIRNIQQTSGVYACDLCKYGGDPYRDEVGEKCPKGCDGLTKWEWRGLCKENGGIEND